MGHDIFCKIISGEVESDRLAENESFIAIKDIHPKAGVHYLIIPKKHIESVADCVREDVDLLGTMMLFGKECADELNLKGYKLNINVGKQGGQEVPHIHLHLLGGKFL